MTADLSPIKGENDDDTHDDRFDLKFVTYLPHFPTSEKKGIDRHSKSSDSARNIKVPPPSPQRARTRRQPKSKIPDTSILRPRNQSPALSMNPPSEQKHELVNKTKQHLVSLRNDFVEAVENTHSDFNKVLRRMSSDKKSRILKNRLNRHSEESELKPSAPVLEKKECPATNSKKTQVPKSMDHIKCYLSQLKGMASERSSTQEVSPTNYQQIFKSKLDSIAKTLFPDVSSIPSCEAHFTSIIEFADELINPPLDKTGFTASTNLDEYWLNLDESDSVSKLSMPFQSFHNSRSELTMSIVSDYDPDEDIMESPAMRRAMAIPCEV